MTTLSALQLHKNLLKYQEQAKNKKQQVFRNLDLKDKLTHLYWNLIAKKPWNRTYSFWRKLFIIQTDLISSSELQNMDSRLKLFMRDVIILTILSFSSALNLTKQLEATRDIDGTKLEMEPMFLIKIEMLFFFNCN